MILILSMNVFAKNSQVIAWILLTLILSSAGLGAGSVLIQILDLLRSKKFRPKSGSDYAAAEFSSCSLDSPIADFSSYHPHIGDYECIGDGGSGCDGG